MTFFVPKGLGMAVNSVAGTNAAASYADHAQAARVLGFRWSYVYSRMHLGPNVMPAVFPEDSGVVPASALSTWRDGMIARGLQWNELTFTLCNEPWGYYQVTPKDLVDLLKAQDREFDRANIEARFNFPNENINGENLEYTIRYFQEARRRRMFIQPAIHIWEKGDNLRNTINDFFHWWAGYNHYSVAVPVTISECGPGPMEPLSVWLETMPTFYALLDRLHPTIGEPMVAALAPFSAYPKYRAGIERHPGFMLPSGALTALGVQYKAEMARRL